MVAQCITAYSMVCNTCLKQSSDHAIGLGNSYMGLDVHVHCIYIVHSVCRWSAVRMRFQVQVLTWTLEVSGADQVSLKQDAVQNMRSVKVPTHNSRPHTA